MSGRFFVFLFALSLTVSLVTVGCDSGGGTGPTIVTVLVTPDSAEVLVGATQQYTARALNASGNPIGGVSFTWSSADANVATVNTTTGLAEGVLAGVTDIRATASGVIGSGRISVVPTANPDPPDDQFLDSNGDGIDGDIDKAIFVATTGDDADPGTRAAPKRTIGAAITEAAGDAQKTEVYVSAGTYMETVQLTAGVSVYGGYNAAAGWERSATNVATVQGDTTAVTGDGIAQQTTVDRLTIASTWPTPA
jgi:hypothetical protein